MPRDGSSIYTKPAGTTAVTGQVIDASDWNSLADDIATELTASLSRDGSGAMTGALQIADGAVGALAVKFSADTDTGIYRVGSNEAALVAGGTVIARWKLDGATAKLLDSAGTATYQALATDISAFAKTILDDADAAAARTTLAAAGSATTITAGTGLTGGGDLSANRTVSLSVSGLTEDTTPDTTADFVATYDTSAATHKKVKLSMLGRAPDVILKNLQVANTAAASCSTSYATLVLNTEELDPRGLTSLSSNEFALPIGTYYAEFRASFYYSGGAHFTARARLYNNSQGVTLIVGEGISVGYGNCHSSHGAGYFSLDATRTLRLQGIAQNAAVDQGRPVNFDSESEVYAEVRVWKLT